MINQHLLILQVIIPLLSAPLCVLLKNRRVAWLFTLLSSLTTFIIAIILLNMVQNLGVISYELGGWSAPWGIEYRLNSLNAFVLLIVSGISTLILGFAYHSVEQEINANRIVLFYTLYLLFLTGLLGITITGDVFNLFVFMEIASLSSYALIAMGNDRCALVASFQYLLLGSIGATFILIAIGLLFIKTGTLNMQDLAQRLPELMDSRTIASAFAFLIVGICLKLALFPFHLWLPNVYTYAPSVVSTLLSATATKVVIYVLLCFVFMIFGRKFAFENMFLADIVLPLSLIAILAASLVAIFQDNLKRMLAYSSIAQTGYIMLGVSFSSHLSLTSSILHLFNHALMKGALFLVLGCIIYRTGVIQLSALSGIGKQMPWTLAAFVLGGLSLIGLPLTVGFISKWYLIAAAIEQDSWLIVVLVVIGTLLTIIYVWRVVEQAYFQPVTPGQRQIQEAPLSLLVPTWVLIVANYYFGMDSRLTVGVAQQSAAFLLAGANP